MLAPASRVESWSASDELQSANLELSCNPTIPGCACFQDLLADQLQPAAYRCNRRTSLRFPLAGSPLQPVVRFDLADPYIQLPVASGLAPGSATHSESSSAAIVRSQLPHAFPAPFRN